MSLELIRETVKVNQTIGEDSAQTIIENDIIVPDVKPDIASILLLDGDTYVNSAEAAQDKININGTIRFKILYISDDPSHSIKSIDTSSNFYYGLDVANARSGAKCRVKCDIEHMEYNILNGRKISIKTIMRISGKVMDEIDHSIISDIRDVNDVQTLKESARLRCFIGENDADCIVRENMEVPAGKPAVREILRSDVKISNKDIKVTDNKVIAKGELNVSTLYIADDERESIQVMEHEIPFTQLIDMPGAAEDSDCEVDFRILDAKFEPAEDSDGELRILNGEVVINLYAAGYEKRNVEIISDAYSPSVKLSLEKESFRTEEVVARSKTQVVLKDTVAIQDESPEIAEVFNVLCKPVISEYRMQEDRVTVEGSVKCNILYLASSEEQPIFCYEQEIPFKQNVDMKSIRGDMECEIGLDIEHCSYSMVSGSEVEVRLVMGLDAKALKQVEIPLTVKIVDQPMESRKTDSQPSLIVYFSKPGDTLWKIAKKYYTTVDYIQKINDIKDQDLLTPGRQIIIPKKVK